MDDESGDGTDGGSATERTETESGASRGIPDDADCVFRISGGGEVTNVACKQSIKPLKLLSPEAHFSPKCTKYRLTVGLRPDPLGELTALPRPPTWI